MNPNRIYIYYFLGILGTGIYCICKLAYFLPENKDNEIYRKFAEIENKKELRLNEIFNDNSKSDSNEVCIIPSYHNLSILANKISNPLLKFRFTIIDYLNSNENVWWILIVNKTNADGTLYRMPYHLRIKEEKTICLKSDTKLVFLEKTLIVSEKKDNSSYMLTTKIRR